MRIGLNFTYLHPGRALGHFRACQGLARGLGELSRSGELRCEPVVFCSEGMEGDFSGFGLETVPCRSRSANPTLRVLFENFALPGILRNHGIDLLHGLGNSGPVLTELPTVITLHDLHHRVYPDQYPWKRKLFFQILAEAALSRAARVAVPSAHAALQARAFLGIRAEVVPWSPLLPRGQTSSGGAPAIPFPYWISISSNLPHKNVARLLKAYRIYREELGGRHSLLLIGSHGGSLPEGVHIAASVSEAVLPELYRASSGLLSASEFEGFGFPLAEALAQGCGVLAFREASIPEVVGKSGSYFPSLDAKEMALALRDFEKAPRPAPGSGPFGKRSWTDVARDYEKIYLSAEASG